MFIFQQLANVSWSYLVRTGDIIIILFFQRSLKKMFKNTYNVNIYFSKS